MCIYIAKNDTRTFQCQDFKYISSKIWLSIFREIVTRYLNNWDLLYQTLYIVCDICMLLYFRNIPTFWKYSFLCWITLDKGHLYTHLKLDLCVTYSVFIWQIFWKKVKHVISSVPLPRVFRFLDDEVDRSQHTRIVTLFCTINTNVWVTALEFKAWSWAFTYRNCS